MKMLHKTSADDLERAHSQIVALRRELAEAQRDIAGLNALLEGNVPVATRWLQGKVTRQRKALDRLTRKVTSQRFVLRTLAGLGRTLSAEEYRTARDAESSEQLRERIEDPPAQ